MVPDLENWRATQVWQAVLELQGKNGFVGGQDVIEAEVQRVFEVVFYPLSLFEGRRQREISP